MNNNNLISNKNNSDSVGHFLFMDDEFPPNKQSLFINGSKIKLLNLIHSKGILIVSNFQI